MELRFEYDLIITLKLGQWAEELPDNIDFTDYWFNLFLSETKIYLDEPDTGTLASFWINRWKNDFEKYVDGYVPIPGDGINPDIRNWVAQYMQYLVYSLQIPSKRIAEFYGKKIFDAVAKMYPKYHCYGVDYFVNSFASEFGLPPEVTSITSVGM